MTARVHEITDEEFEVQVRNLVRLVSVCTLGLWSFCCGPADRGLLSVLNSIADGRIPLWVIRARFGDVGAASALPLIADVRCEDRQVRKVPEAAVPTRVCCVPIRRSRRAVSYSRLPNSFDLKRFVSAGPRWHGHADGFERLSTIVSELKLCARRDGDRHSGEYVHNLFAIIKAAPHPTSSAYEVPNLLDRLVSNCFRHKTRA